MKRRYIIRVLALIMFAIPLAGCGHKDKEIVLTAGVPKAVSQHANEISKSMELGNKLLDEKKYDDAKKAYETAINLDKTNKSTYLTIENNYLSKGRLQDAADIIQKAIDNKVDVDNMKSILEGIQQKINSEKEVKNSAKTIKNNTNNDIKSADENKNINTNANNNIVSNNKATSSETKITKEFLHIKDVYGQDGKKYIYFSRDKIYMGDEGKAEAAKDGVAGWAADGYVRQNPKDIGSYELADGCVFNVGGYIINYKADRNIYSLDYDKFKKVVFDAGLKEKQYDPINLYWVTLKDGKVTQIDSYAYIN